jgi:hypothetical protein
MALSPESLITNFERSIKSFTINLFQVENGVPCFFDWLKDVPEDDLGVKLPKWVVTTFGSINKGTVNSVRLEFHLFSRQDDEGSEIIKLLDVLYGATYDDEDGIIAIPLYDTNTTPWTFINGILPYHQITYRTIFAKDDTKIKTVRFECKWGGK